MLETLCGNKNIAKILLFLFVNGRCYGTQMQRVLQTALTPIQKALQRLEKGGIITSYYEGKTRLYRFNPGYPLMDELEQLIKKNYTLLPGQEKRRYYAPKIEVRRASNMNTTQVLLTCWERLSSAKKITFYASTKQQHGWDGSGKGEVSVTKVSNNTLIFQEKGSWQKKEGIPVNFTNAFRWTLDRLSGVISLEHLRQGPEHPVFIFHLAPSDKATLTSVDSHLCQGDAYFGRIHIDDQSLRLHWRVIGPKKNEEMDYFYS